MFTRLTSKYSRRCFEWPFQIPFGRFPKEVNGDGLGIVEVLESHECLDKERLSVFEVAMEEYHHRDA